MGTKNLSLSDALFTRAKQQVLGLLFCAPDKDFYTNEIIRLTHCGTGSIQRELTALAQAGLVVMQRAGNQKRYHANKASPIYDELRTIVMKTFGLAMLLKQEFDKIAITVDICFIYGSIAKKNDSAASDIDVMIIGEDLSYAEFFEKFNNLEQKLGRKINPVFSSIEEWKQKSQDNAFFRKLLEEPKIFIKGNEDELKKLK